MNEKAQKPNRPEKLQSPRFLRWIISGLYLLSMVWLMLLSPTGGYGAPEAQPWLVLALIAATVSYAMLMLWLWPNEKAAGRPGRLVP